MISEMAMSTPESATESEKDIAYGSFTGEQLYQTIISELSARRELNEAGDNYLDLAIETKDLSIIQRAIQFASVNNDVNALMQLGLLWSEVEPNNSRPHLMLSFQFSKVEITPVHLIWLEFSTWVMTSTSLR